MTRLEELTLKLADDSLSDEKAAELVTLLAESDDARQTHFQLIHIEAGLRAIRTIPDLAPAILTQLHRDQEESIATGVMRQIRELPVSDRPPEAIPNTDPANPEPGVVPFPVAPSATRRSRRRIWLPLAACLALLIGPVVWWLAPVTGDPVLAEIQGGDLILERAGHLLRATPGMRLQSGDRLRTSDKVAAVIGFSPETTRFLVRTNTEFTLISVSGGKHYGLGAGSLEASVARQRPFHPMLFGTPQAEARVIGTKFTLMTTTTATRLEVAEGEVRLTRAGDRTHVDVPARHYAIAAAGIELCVLPRTGGILCEFWTGIPGGEIKDLLDHPDYPSRPVHRYELNNFETPVIQTNNFACRLSGHIHPPTTGDYTFWIASGGSGALWLSPDEDPSRTEVIATTRGGLPRQWDAPNRRNELMMSQSPKIPLVAGRCYFIQAVEKSATNSSHIEVAWMIPGAEREIISAEFLSPLTGKTKEKKR